MFHDVRQVFRLVDGATRRQGIVLAILLMLNGIAEMMSVGAIVPFLSVATRDIGGQHAAIRAVYEYGGFTSQSAFTVFLAGAIAALFLLRTLFMAFVQYYLHAFVGDARTRLSILFMRGYLSLPYIRLLGISSLAMSRKLNQSIPDIFTGSVVPTILLAGEIIAAGALVVLLLMADFWVTVVTMVAFGIILVVVQRMTGPRLRGWGDKSMQSYQRALTVCSHVFGAMKEIKVMNRGEAFTHDFQEAVAGNAHCRLMFNTVSQYPKMVLEMLGLWAFLAVVAITIVSGHSLLDILPTLGLFGVAAMRLLPGLSRINVQLSNLKYNGTLVHDLLEDMNSFEQVASRAPQPQDIRFADRIEIRDLAFTYPQAETSALDGVSLTIPHGQWVAIVGSSGSGKTSLFNVLLGLMSPDRGDILVDGRSAQADTAAWQARLGYVPQDVFILDDTLRANIVFGADPKPGDEARLAEAVELAQLRNLVDRLPDGLESAVGERGSNLSGGERQRIGIARALFHGAEVLMLDEATSALDAVTEAAIGEALMSLKGRKTIIVIAHRLSSIKSCDTIFLLERGKLAAQGTFSQLVAENAAFATLVERMSMETA